MIRLTLPPDLAPRQRYGLEALVDLSRLLIVADPTADVVRLEVVEAGTCSLEDLLQRGIPLEPRDGVVAVGRSALEGITALAGAGVEQASTAADRHGRVPTAENPLVRAGKERQAIAQRWAEKFGSAVREAAGRRPVRYVAPWPNERRWAAAITHDLDIVSGWPLFALWRALELARHGDWNRVRQSLGGALRAIGSDPVRAGVQRVLDAEREAGVHSTWFVLCGSPSLSSWLQGDVTYALESAPAGRLLETVRTAEHEIGLHGSFRTALDGVRLRQEHDRLARILGAPPAGIRQHFLRMRPDRTPALAEAAGFTYDATFGFPDRNGFRTGVADVLPAWRAEAASGLDIVPLVWMDRALSKYHGMQDPDAWVADGLELAATARSAQGLWVGLWHPNLTLPLGFPGAPEAFERLLRSLSAAAPWFATLEQIVRWRRSRRTARAARVAPDGRVELAISPRAEWPIRLEDGAGRGVPGA